MLAHALSRPYTKANLSNKLKLTHPSPPPNSPHCVNPEITIDINCELDEQEESDGIDFSRLRSELDRLLEEGVQEPDDDAANEGHDQSTIDVKDQANRVYTTISVLSAERLSCTS